MVSTACSMASWRGLPLKTPAGINLQARIEIMATLEELFFTDTGQMRAHNASLVNPFTEEDSLLEAQILEVRYDGIRSTLGIIFEMRLAEIIGVTSTALLVASNVSQYSWRQVERHGGSTAWTVIGAIPKNTESGLSLELTASPSASLSFTARRAVFYILRIAHLEGSPPPDYVDDDIRAIRAGVACWNSEAEVVRVDYIDPRNTSQRW
ncbi:hypothetical protein [Mycolicibacterium wolinskyi]|uniref:hypothetical protein n=1 Tax=Mycolicibacterium wolinskyi TaxID=59750 RepID=UPI000A9154B6|nr:hypothetical protein [Mycolicibacterium wolinskyi]